MRGKKHKEKGGKILAVMSRINTYILKPYQKTKKKKTGCAVRGEEKGGREMSTPLAQSPRIILPSRCTRR